MRQRIFLAIAAIPTVAFTAYALFSIWPYHDLIGKAIAVLIIVLITCLCVLAINFTVRKVRGAEVYSEGPYMVIRTKTGYINVGADHERAKLQLPAPVTVTEEKEDEPGTSKETILEMYNKGMHLRDIAKATNSTYYQVQKITAGQ